MKKKDQYVIFQLPIEDGKIQEAIVMTDQLREVLKNAKISKDTEEVELKVEFGGESYRVPITISQIRKLIKQSDLCLDFVPKYLRKYLVDYTQLLKEHPICPIIGRKHEIEKVWFYLSQPRRNNVFLIGDKEVGKTAIASEIARQISTAECPKEFYNTRVLMLKPEMLLKIENDYIYEKIINKIIAFLGKHKKEIVLYIDNSLYMKTDIFLISMLNSCITKLNIPIITTSSVENFEQYFEEDQSISKHINSIYVEEPDLEEIESMIKYHIRRFKKQYKIEISREIIKFGIFTSGLSDSVSVNPGKVINIFERAFLEAKRKDKQNVDKKCILSCYNTHIKEYEKMPIEEKTATAYHETGHYILATKSKNFKDIKISCVSNLPMSWWAGVTMPYYNSKEYSVHSREYYIDYIAFTLGGRIAEKKFTNLNSTGASNDLEMANEIAKAMVMSWGFSKNELNCNRKYDLEDYYLMPESKKQLIDKEVQEIINEATKRAEEVIKENEKLLKIIAEKLLEEEVLTGEQLTKICKENEK